MKRISFTFLFNLFILYFCVSCNRLYHHDINIHVSESVHSYSMYANYPPGETRTVEEYMNYKIGNANNMSFINTRIDGQLTLDDHTTFHIKKYPGYIKIKLDKEKNSEQSYRHIKDICDGIKKVLAGK